MANPSLQAIQIVYGLTPITPSLEAFQFGPLTLAPNLKALNIVTTQPPPANHPKLKALNIVGVDAKTYLYGSTWKGSATPVIDSSVSKNHGTAIGRPVLDGPCPTIGFSSGRSVLFNGTSQYINLGDPASLEAHVGAFGVCTITAWIKPVSFVTQQAIMGKYQNGGGDNQREYGFVVRIGTDAGKFNFFCYKAIDSGNNISVYSTNVLTAGIWSHVAAVYDNTQVGVLNKIKLYLNGVQETGVNRSTGAFTFVSDTAILTAIGSLEGASANNPFNGNIDDVRYYNRALDATEIATIASGALGAMDSALVGWWTLDSLGGVEINS